MANWNGSTRRQRLPPDWPTRRARALRRDGHRCRAPLPDGTRCPNSQVTGHPLEVDHIRRGDDHSLENLQTLCTDHHQAKTIAERRPPRQRPPERHPGAL